VFYSPIFLKQEAEKKRVLHDLKCSGANKSVRRNSVKQDGIKTLKGLISPGDRFALWDLRKMFFQFTVQPRLRPMLRTQIWLKEMGRWTRRRLQNATLSMGLTVAPEIVTKFFACVLQVFKEVGYRTAIKVDDLIAVLPNDVTKAHTQCYVITRVLVRLGAVLSGEKCDFNLRHQVKWHGMHFCSIVEVCSLPPDKVTKTVGMVATFQGLLESNDAVITIRALASLIGTLVAAMEAVDAVRLMVMDFQALRAYLMQDKTWEWEKKCEVSAIPDMLRHEVIEACKEWRRGCNPAEPHRVHWNGKLMYSRLPLATIYTDACEWQRGVWVAADTKAGLEEISLPLPFADDMMFEHITLQETVAAADGVIEVILRRGYRDCVLKARIDATAALKYIQCLGGRKYAFNCSVRDLQRLLRQRKIMLVADHVPGEQNPADAPSRKVVALAEYRLCLQAFNTLNRRWGPFGIDLCAAGWNKQLPRYLSMQRSDPMAEGYDVLTHPMQDENRVMYCFPPPHKKLIMEILQRVKSCAVAEMVIVMPAWASTELAAALAMAVDMPMVFECCPELLLPPKAYGVHLPGAGHRRWWTRKQWGCFIGIRLSGSVARQEGFRSRWRSMRESATKKGEMESTLIRSTRYWWPLSNNCTTAVTLLCRMLSSLESSA
jgi:hypothetical protein